MNKTKKMIIAMAAVPMMFATASAYAFGGKGGHGMDGRGDGFDRFDRGLINELDLTEEQKDQLRDLREAKREDRKANRSANMESRQAEMKAQHAAMQELVLADTFDQAKAQELAKAMVEKQTERRVQALAAKHEMMSILTAEQKEKLKELQAERWAEMSEKMANRMGKGKSN